MTTLELHRRPEVIRGLYARLDEAVAQADDAGEFRSFLDWSLTSVDRERYADIHLRHIRDEPETAKYLNFVWFARHKFAQLKRIGCAQGTSRKRILDLGCGPCHLGLAARYFGHETVGLDAPLAEPHLYTELCALFGVKKYTHRMGPNVPLPRLLLGSFDYVTCTMTEFDLYPVWTVEEWKWFVNDARRLLRTDGYLYVTLTSNRRRPHEVWEYFERTARWKSGHHAFVL
jgi:SAM-dependent methyltransferase